MIGKGYGTAFCKKNIVSDLLTSFSLYQFQRLLLLSDRLNIDAFLHNAFFYTVAPIQSFTCGTANWLICATSTHS